MKRIPVIISLVASIYIFTGCYTTLTSSPYDRTYAEIVGSIVNQFPVALPSGALVMTAEYYQNRRAERERNVDSFIIGPGTPLRIVFAQEDISETKLVSPNNTISFDLVENIPTQGKTLTELEDRIEAELSRFYINPDIRIEIPENAGEGVQAGSVKVINMGGSSVISALSGDPDRDLLDTVLIKNGWVGAGDWNEVAVHRTREVVVGREGESETIKYIILCDLEKLIYEFDTRQNIPIYDKDLIYIHLSEAPILNEMLAVLNIAANSFFLNVRRYYDFTDLIQSRF
ncbi:MAG: polysaccharide biosynthesis/export family protein [Planctomycetes bacterium]|nr:polysaccharide biosynthesis/export family protein [Planctomycetota bacterium]